ncbi:Ras-related protein Rab-14 [Balamuthia mandrillaris]
MLTILDTAGQEQFMEYRRESVEQSQGFLIIFDVTQQLSFEEVESFLNELCGLKRRPAEELAIIIVGTKGDVDESQRAVTKEEAQRFALENGCSYVEASARTGEGVPDVIHKLLKEITYRQREAKKGWLRRAPSRKSKHLKEWDRHREKEEREDDETEREKGGDREKGSKETSMRKKFVGGVVFSSSYPASHIIPQRWKKEWVVMDKENIRHYKKSSSAAQKRGKAQNIISLKAIESAAIADEYTNRSNTFCVLTSEKAYFYCCESEEERDSWIYEICKHASKAQDKEVGNGEVLLSMTPRIISSPDLLFQGSSSSSAVLTTVSSDQHLRQKERKKNHGNGRWVARRFALSSDDLRTHLQPKEKPPLAKQRMAGGQDHNTETSSAGD